jgi:release factor glutamine methyltransferase
VTLREAVALLEAAGCETARLDAEVLLAHALGVERLRLFGRQFDDPPAGFDELIERRAQREPVAYITGSRGFRHIELAVDPRVLIPRPETEHLVEAALTLPINATVLDVGTGSGAVALALKHERSDFNVAATDISEEALAVARANAERLELDVTFVHGDLLAGLTADAVVSNPPYVEPDADVPPELAFEPGQALFGDVYARLVPEAVAVADFVALEIGADQAERVAALFPTTPEIVKDLAGHDRVVVWRR